MDVPWETAERIKSAITGSDVEAIYIEDADHRLSMPEQLNILDQTLESLLQALFTAIFSGAGFGPIIRPIAFFITGALCPKTAERPNAKNKCNGQKNKS